jgi:hypothetical protein
VLPLPVAKTHSSVTVSSAKRRFVSAGSKCDTAWFEDEDINAAIKGIDEDLEVYRKRYPTLVEDIQRRMGNFWTGQTRKAMMNSLEAQLPKGGNYPKLLDTYKMFSWHSHSTLAAVLGMTLTEEDGETRIRFGPTETPEEAADFHCTIAERLLRDAWKSFDKAFNTPS